MTAHFREGREPSVRTPHPLGKAGQGRSAISAGVRTQPGRTLQVTQVTAGARPSLPPEVECLEGLTRDPDPDPDPHRDGRVPSVEEQGAGRGLRALGGTWR